MTRLGESTRRVEDPRFLRGQGRFVADIEFLGMLEGMVVRSPHAHARIGRINAAKALRMPGVVAIWTAQDLPRPCPIIPPRLSSTPELQLALQPVLAETIVRYVGEPVALVVATNRYVAEDAAALIEVEYQPLPVVGEMGDGAVNDPVNDPLHPGMSDNVIYRRRFVKGDVETVLQSAPHRLSLNFQVQRHSGVPLETRGLVARPIEDRIEVYGPTKVVHFNRSVLAQLLGWPIERIRFIEPDVGGGFGIRGEFYPEDFLIPFAALKLRCPVRWIEDRREHLMSSNHSRQQDHSVQVGFSDEGRLLALCDTIWVDSGAYVRTHGVTVPELTQAMLPGPYDWPALDIAVNVCLTNKTPTGTYRGPGRFEGTFVRERTLDAIANELGLDPIRVRRINLIPPEKLPYSNGLTALGQEVVFDSGDYQAALDRALMEMNYTGFPDRRRESAKLGRLRGFGVACFVEKSGLGPWETARIALLGDGKVACFSGLAALGQGTETMLAQIVASNLAMDMEDVLVVHGDTDSVPTGHGTFASRGAVVGGTAAYRAAEVLKDRIIRVGAQALEAHPDDMVLKESAVFVRGVPAKKISFAAIWAEADRLGIELDVEERFEAQHMTYPYGVHCAEMEIDPLTGEFRVLRYGVAYDVGRAINPALVQGQIVGGVAQGIGGAWLEELAYDSEGQLLSASLMDYLLPGAPEVPDVEVWLTEDAPAPSNPLGTKGSGEGGVVGVAPALANAIVSALGISDQVACQLPLTPERVRTWVQLRKEGGL